jgi:hypothetical protein
MTKIEAYLIEKGYTPVLKKKGETYPSTMGNLYCTYIKGDDVIECGLNEGHKPPTYIAPRPKVYVVSGVYYFYTDMRDDMCNAMMNDFDCETFLQYMKGEKEITQDMVRKYYPNIDEVINRFIERAH